MDLSTVNWGSVADWVVAGTAVVGVGFGLSHLKALRASEAQAAAAHRDQVQIARATLLRQIDAEFESEEMYRSRKAIRALRNRSEMAMRHHHGEASNETIAQLSAAEFARQLTLLWHEARKFDDADVESAKSPARIAADRYSEIMRLPNWFEALGLMLRRGLLPKNDVLEIYDAAIAPTMFNLTEHVRKRRDDGPHPNPRFLEHAMWLGEEARAFIESKNKPLHAVSIEPQSPWT